MTEQEYYNNFENFNILFDPLALAPWSEPTA